MPGVEPDEAWEAYGKRDPYFGVLADERYRSSRLDDRARAEFFRTGEEHVASVLATVRRRLDAEFRPSRALDFGCGVGRLLVPLAAICEEVVGVDVSESMLAEAHRNCERRAIDNVRLVRSDDGLTAVRGRFDLVHSVIVFQHIPPPRGLEILRALLEVLEDGGVGVLHFTFARRAPRLRRTVHWLRKRVPLVHGAVNLVQGRPFSYPMMQMNDYDLARVLEILQRAGVTESFVELTDHGGHLGAMLYFRKPGAAA
jgi:SAM-dependent methyltransferase